MKLIIALDFSSLADAEQFISELGAKLPPSQKQNVLLKVGMWLFYSAGASIIARAKAAGFGVFLDLKLNDIPNTISAATAALAAYEIDILSVHSAAGAAGLAAAVEAAAGRFEIFAISVLTSMSQADLAALDIAGDVQQVVANRAKMAAAAGCAGVVCSAHEAAAMREFGLAALCPGIRQAGADAHDQSRVATPEFAREQGASYIVMGRGILRALRPIEKVNEILRSIND